MFTYIHNLDIYVQFVIDGANSSVVVLAKHCTTMSNVLLSTVNCSRSLDPPEMIIKSTAVPSTPIHCLYLRLLEMLITRTRYGKGHYHSIAAAPLGALPGMRNLANWFPAHSFGFAIAEIGKNVVLSNVNVA